MSRMRWLGLLLILPELVLAADSRGRLTNLVVLNCRSRNAPAQQRCLRFQKLLTDCGYEISADAKNRPTETAASFTLAPSPVAGGLVSFCAESERVRKTHSEPETALVPVLCAKDQFETADTSHNGVLEVGELKRLLAQSLGGRSRARSGQTGEDLTDPCLTEAQLSLESPQLKGFERGLPSPWLFRNPKTEAIHGERAPGIVDSPSVDDEPNH